MDSWHTKADKAARWIYLIVESEQKVFFENREDSVKI